MSVQEFIHAMPKVELHVHLEGALQKERLLLIAEQNEIALEDKKFNDWVQLLNEPDYTRLYELQTVTSGWLRHPDDLAHVTYELGVSLARQNIRYAEVYVTPTYFTEHSWSFDETMKALNDGRDRAQRGWNVDMRWVLSIDRNYPRHADEIVRLASSAPASSGIVGVDLGGPETAQPVGQFERAFKTASRKAVPTSVHAGEELGEEGILAVLNDLEPDRLITGWGAAESKQVQSLLVEQNIPLAISITQAVRSGWIDSYADYPLRRLYEDGIKLVLSAGLPSLYQSLLNDEYLLAVEACGLEIEELEEVALNAVAASRLSPDEKTALEEEFKQTYTQLRKELLTGESEETSQ